MKYLLAFTLFLFASNAFSEEFVCNIIVKTPKPYTNEYYLFFPEENKEYLVKWSEPEQFFLLIDASVKRFKVNVSGRLKYKAVKDPVFVLEKIQKN